jgi:uncharacterized protein
MIQFEAHPDGVVLPVRVQAGARRNTLRSPQDGSLRVCVTQAPEKGKANKAVVETLAKALKLRKTQLALLSGQTSRQKRFLVRQISQSELSAKLEEALSVASD